MTDSSKTSKKETQSTAAEKKRSNQQPGLAPGASPFPNTSSELVPNTGDDTPCSVEGTCASEGGTGSEDPGQGSGGGSKSGLSIRATRQTVEGTEVNADAKTSRMVFFYMECDGTELESLGLDELFKVLAMRAQKP